MRQKKNPGSKAQSKKLTLALIGTVQAAGMAPGPGALFLIDSSMFLLQHAAARREDFDRYKAAAADVVARRIWPYPTRGSGTIPGSGGRTWAEVDDWLRSRGSILDQLVQEKMIGRSAEEVMS